MPDTLWATPARKIRTHPYWGALSIGGVSSYTRCSQYTSRGERCGRACTKNKRRDPQKLARIVRQASALVLRGGHLDIGISTTNQISTQFGYFSILGLSRFRRPTSPTNGPGRPTYLHEIGAHLDKPARLWPYIGNTQLPIFQYRSPYLKGVLGAPRGEYYTLAPTCAGIREDGDEATRCLLGGTKTPRPPPPASHQYRPNPPPNHQQHHLRHPIPPGSRQARSPTYFAIHFAQGVRHRSGYPAG